MATKAKKSFERRCAPTNNPNAGLVLRGGQKVVNELCYCGALRTEHSGLIGHGSCDRTGCEKFTWKDFEIEGEPRTASGLLVRP